MASSELLTQVRGVVTGITAKASGTEADATALTGRINVIATCATNNDSVILPALQPLGTTIYINNEGAADVKIFPNASGTIQGGTATTAGVVVGENQGAICVQAASTGLTWLAILTASLNPSG